MKKLTITILIVVVFLISAISGFSVPGYTLDITESGSGSVTKDPSEQYYFNTTVTLTAVPAAGWKFKEWTGHLTGTTNPKTIFMDGDKSITAVFVNISTTTTTLPLILLN